MELKELSYEVGLLFLHFGFTSHGPNGVIQKAIRFHEQYLNDDTPYFNLSFGDWDDETKKIDDLTVSNNRDKEKIFSTISLAIIEVTNRYNEYAIQIKGSTRSRTRLYQITINKHYEEINKLFVIYGQDNLGMWKIFKRNIHYNAFLLFRRNT